jgi:hypothetical protein
MAYGIWLMAYGGSEERSVKSSSRATNNEIREARDKRRGTGGKGEEDGTGGNDER